MNETVLSFWSREFGDGEHSAAQVAARASPAFMKVLLQVAADPTGTRVNPMLLDLWLRDIAGRPIGVHVLRRRGTLWLLERGPEDIAECSDCPAPVLPSDPTPADHLAANLRKALRRQAEFLDLPLDPTDPRLNRLIAEVANQTVIAVIKAQEKSLQAKRDEEHDRLMEARFAERQKFAEAEIARLNAASSRTVHVNPSRLNLAKDLRSHLCAPDEEE